MDINLIFNLCILIGFAILLIGFFIGICGIRNITQSIVLPVFGIAMLAYIELTPIQYILILSPIALFVVVYSIYRLVKGKKEAF
ncbi:hypothetical protein [Cytobacillus gottheilii]|uniref:hypothetical protein n=1 Tax=Cytobacillus gottheilii TaxID=859144 RepID=UPI002494DBDC|nr:hypothetical protein [Cytobacillus gottheilii]